MVEKEAYANVCEDFEDEKDWNYKDVRQIKIRDMKNDVVHGAIMLPSGDAICGCCGRIFSADDRFYTVIKNADVATWEVLEDDLPWLNLDDAILGDDKE